MTQNNSLDELWDRYMGKYTTPMEYRADVLAQGRIHELRDILENDLTSMYLATGEMDPDEIKRVAFEVWQALEAEMARQGAYQRRMEKYNQRQAR